VNDRHDGEVLSHYLIKDHRLADISIGSLRKVGRYRSCYLVKITPGRLPTTAAHAFAIYVVRDAQYGTNFTVELPITLVAVALVFWGRRTRKRWGYLWSSWWEQ